MFDRGRYLIYALLTLLCLISLTACSGVVYRISGFDEQLNVNPNQDADATTCRPAIVRLEWERSFDSSLINSSSYAGKKDDYIFVNQVALLEGAMDAIEKSSIPICANISEALITVQNVDHRNHVAPETGVFYASVRITLLAKVECDMPGTGKYDLYTGREHKNKVGLWPPTDDIQRVLVKSSSEAAVSVLMEVLKQCY